MTDNQTQESEREVAIDVAVRAYPHAEDGIEYVRYVVTPIVEALLAARFRRQGPATDAEVLAALNAYDPRFATENLDDYAEEHQADMRAALEAARSGS